MIALLPRSARSALGRTIGFLWFDVLKIRRKVAVDNVGIAFPELSEAERTELARSSLHHFGESIIEYALFPFFKHEHVAKAFSVRGEEHVKKALAEGHGAIFLTLHLGNGDYAIAAVSRLGYPLNLISKEFKARWLNHLWFGMRRRHGTKFIAPEKSSFEILRALRRNEIVVFVLDQFMGPPVGARTRFFGKETGTAMGCALMAERTKAPVIPVYTWRKPDGTHEIVFEEPIPFLRPEAAGNVAPSADKASGSSRLVDSLREKNIAAMTQIYTDKIESIVRRHPEQWMWIHRRWKEFRD